MNQTQILNGAQYFMSEMYTRLIVGTPNGIILSGAAISNLQQGVSDNAWLPIAGAVVPLIGLFVLIVRNMSDQHFEQFKEYKAENKELSQRVTDIENQKEEAERKIAKLNEDHLEEIDKINKQHVRDVSKAVGDSLAENNRKHNIEIDRLKKDNIATIERRVTRAVADAVAPLQQQIKFYQDRETQHKEEREKFNRDMLELTSKYNDLNDRFDVMKKENDTMRRSVTAIEKKDTDRLVPPPNMDG